MGNKNTLRIRFLGAIGTVTGSCTLIEYVSCEDSQKQYFLIDAGSFVNETSEQDDERKKIIKCIAKDIKIIFITHAHLDHIGILPDIIKYGFKGKICCTQATHKLIGVMLTYGEGNENNNNLLKKISFLDIDGRHGEKQNFGFGKTYFNINHNFRYGMIRSSHVLGSCTIYFQWTEKNYPLDISMREKEWKYLYFSGDIGPSSDKISPNLLFKGHQTPYWDEHDKCIIMEATYGEKNREKNNLLQRKIDRLSEIIDKTIKKNGTVIIPAFALDRAQQILIDLFCIFKNNEQKNESSFGNMDNWVNILQYLFKDTMIKNIISSNKIKTLQGQDKKSLRKKITKEIEQLCQKLNIKNDTLYKDFPNDGQILLVKLFEQNKIEKPNLNDDSSIRNRLNYYYDSPLIEKINEVYYNHLTDESYSSKDDKRKLKYLSDEFTKYFGIVNDYNANDDNFLELKSEIKKILSFCFNKDVKSPKIIVAASGMCDEGRIVYLLEKYFTDENATIILTGFQASGTNGFLLKNLLDEKYDDNEKKTIPLKLNRSDFRLADRKCNIEDMSEFYSGHADQEQLIDYITPDERNTGKITVLLNHGTNSARETLKAKIEEKNKNIKVKVPEFNKWLNLVTFEYEPEDIESDTEENVELVFLKIGDVHIYYPNNYDTEKVQSIINCINEL
jgi:Cft2 family RNA processing exonuclease